MFYKYKNIQQTALVTLTHVDLFNTGTPCAVMPMCIKTNIYCDKKQLLEAKAGLLFKIQILLKQYLFANALKQEQIRFHSCNTIASGKINLFNGDWNIISLENVCLKFTL